MKKKFPNASVKRILAALTALVLALGLCVSAISAAEGDPIKDAIYRLTKRTPKPTETPAPAAQPEGYDGQPAEGQEGAAQQGEENSDGEGADQASAQTAENETVTRYFRVTLPDGAALTDVTSRLAGLYPSLSVAEAYHIDNADPAAKVSVYIYQTPGLMSGDKLELVGLNGMEINPRMTITKFSAGQTIVLSCSMVDGFALTIRHASPVRTEQTDSYPGTQTDSPAQDSGADQQPAWTPGQNLPPAQPLAPAADVPAQPLTPAAEEPAAEEPAAPAEEPAAEQPAEEAAEPAAEEPAEQPAEEDPAAEEPAAPAEEPAAEQPAEEAAEPAAEEPAAEEPAAEEPAAPAEEPAAGQPAEEAAEPVEPAAEDPASEEPETPAEKPAAEQPAEEAAEPAEDPAAEEPETPAEKPAAEEPASEEPAAEDPAAEKLAAEEPASEEPAAEDPAAEEPAAEQPAEEAAEPAAEDPAAEEPETPAAPAEESAEGQPAEEAAEPAAEDPAAEEQETPAAPAEEPEEGQPAGETAETPAEDPAAEGQEAPAGESGEGEVETAADGSGEPELTVRSVSAEMADGAAAVLTGDLPEGASLTVRQLAVSVVKLIDQAGKKDKDIRNLYAFELDILDADGAPVDPAGRSLTLTVSGGQVAEALAQGKGLSVSTLPGNIAATELSSTAAGDSVSFPVEWSAAFRIDALSAADAPVQPEQDGLNVRIESSMSGMILLGDTITLTSFVENPPAVLAYQWECDRGEGYQPVEGAVEDSYSFTATEESVLWNWRLTVIADSVQPAAVAKE